MNKAVSFLPVALVLGLFLAPSAQAFDLDGWGNTSLKTGSGDEITIKNGLFGSKTRVVKDRLGDKYVSKKGLLGNTNKEVAIFGNSYSKKRGIFGTRETEVKSLFGDSFKTKKNLFGYRSTQIDASGVSSLVSSAIQGLTTKPIAPLHEPNTFGAQGNQGTLSNPAYDGSSFPAGNNAFPPVSQEAPLDAVTQSLDSQQ